jgi:hypothetical protein
VTYLVETFARPHRLTGAHLVDVPDGATAVHVAEVDLAAAGSDFAELYAADGAGGTNYYTTVEAR